MNRSDAYRVLAEELRSCSAQGYDSLVAKIGQTARRAVRIGQEELTIETVVRWHHVREQSLRIESVALGPSCWMLERLEESMVIRPIDQSCRFDDTANTTNSDP